MVILVTNFIPLAMLENQTVMVMIAELSKTTKGCRNATNGSVITTICSSLDLKYGDGSK